MRIQDLFFLLILMAGGGRQATAQQPVSDNLFSEKPAGQQVISWDSMAAANVGNNPGISMQAAEHAVSKAEQFGDSLLLAHALFNRAKAAKMLNQYDRAIADLTRSRRLYNAAGKNNWVISVDIDFGNLYFMRNENEKAAKYYLQALRLAEEINDTETQALCDNNIANIYLAENQFDKAVAYYIKSYKVTSAKGDSMRAALSLDNIAVVYYRQGKYDEASLYQNAALQIVEKLHDRKFLAEVLMNCGALRMDTRKYDDALRYLNRALSTYTELNSRYGIAGCLVNIGEVYRIKKDFPRAIAALERSVAISDSIHELASLSEGLANLSQTYEDMGQNGKALEYYKKYTAIKDSVLNQDNFNQINELSAKYEADKRQKEIELLTKNKEVSDIRLKNSRTIISSVIAGIVLIGLLLALTIYRVREKQRANRLLEEKNKDIHEQKELVSVKNKEITDSINYARRIQEAMLPSHKILNEYFRENFVFYRPKDIISGDFYWATRKNDQLFIAAADCTGHGVPGALMSMIGISFLRQIINEMNITDPALILNRLHEMVLHALNEDLNMRASKDGMDIALLKVDIAAGKAEFAGAVRPVYVKNKEGFSVIRGDRYSIGGVKTMEESFNKVSISLTGPVSFYMFSDGFADQFGEATGKKFMIKKLQQLLDDNSGSPMEEQARKIESTFNNWKGQLDQTDDVMLIGLKV